MPILKLKKLDAATAAKFPKGARIRCVGGIMSGREGTVYQPVRSRGVICVEFDNHGCLFDSRPEYLEAIS